MLWVSRALSIKQQRQAKHSCPCQPKLCDCCSRPAWLLTAHCKELGRVKRASCTLLPTQPQLSCRSKDGSSGTATFTFKDPAIFEEQEELGDITGLYMTDDEGTIQVCRS